jgi:hypothetical protein
MKVEEQPQVPFGFAQGRLSTAVAAATYAQDDSFMGLLSISA